MVPIGEMADTLKVVRHRPRIRPDDYVRLKRTMYKGDLAQVEYVDIERNNVHLRLLPRIDFKKLKGQSREVRCFMHSICCYTTC